MGVKQKFTKMEEKNYATVIYVCVKNYTTVIYMCELFVSKK